MGRFISGILVGVKRAAVVLLTFLGAAVVPIAAQQGATPRALQQPPGSPPASVTPAPAQQSAASARNVLRLVLDPAHGGTDNGARGSGNAIEKNIVLELARAARASLEPQGFRVLMTRQGDENPSYDDRAAMANAHREVVFISFHVSSTGRMGTVRAYSYPFWTPFSIGTSASPAASGLPVWEEAQRPYADASHKLADLIQTELAQSFPGSPTVSLAAAVRSLRSVTSPAVAIEISSVSSGDEHALESLGAPLAAALGRALNEYCQMMAAANSAPGTN